MVEGSSDITLDGDLLSAPYASVLATIDGQSSAITLSRSTVETEPNEDGLDVAAGAGGIVVTTDRFYYYRKAPLNIVGAPGTVVVSNTFYDDGACDTALSLTGDSSGSTIENNAMLLGSGAQGCANWAPSSPVLVSAGSTGNTTVDYNTVESASTGAVYSWGGQQYTTPAALTAATGQGAHDAYLAISATTTADQVRALITDSALTTAPDELTTDFSGQARVDDPLVPNTGTGIGYVDRGASEYQDPYAAVPAVSVAKGPAPLTETVTAAETNPWHTPIAGYTFSFGDGSGPVWSATPSVPHTYAATGSYLVTVAATGTDGKVFRSSNRATVTVAPLAPLVPHLNVGHVYGRDSLTVMADAAGSTDDWSLTETSLDFGDGTPVQDLGRTDSLAAVHTYARPGIYPATLTVKDAGGNTATTTVQVTVGSAFVPLEPVRILDTRSGLGARREKVGPGGTVRVKIAGAAGLPATGITAVTLNLTGVKPSSGGYVTAYRDGTAVPTASNLNLVRDQTVANQVTVPVSADGYIELYNSSGSLDLLADVQGYYSTTASTGTAQPTGLVQGSAPTRVLDTRPGNTTGHSTLGPGTSTTIDVPDSLYSFATALVLNVTETHATAASWVGLEPAGGGIPHSSDLNFAPGQTSANLIIAPIDSHRQIQLYNSAGNVDLIADIEGYITPQDTNFAGSPYFPLAPTRVLDTRTGSGHPLGAKATLTLKVTGANGIPTQAKAVLVNLTGVTPTTSTYLTAYPHGSTLPGSSDLNLAAGTTRPNFVLVPVGTDGSIDIYNASGTTHVIADIEGYYTG